jgi:hypothetical protein
MKTLVTFIFTIISLTVIAQPLAKTYTFKKEIAVPLARLSMPNIKYCEQCLGRTKSEILKAFQGTKFRYIGKPEGFDGDAARFEYSTGFGIQYIEITLQRNIANTITWNDHQSKISYYTQEIKSLDYSQNGEPLEFNNRHMFPYRKNNKILTITIAPEVNELICVLGTN